MSLKEYSVQDLLTTLITKNLANPINPFFMVEDLNKEGVFVETDNDKCRIMIGNEFDGLLFRGQNRDWDFTSSYSRITSPLEKCIHWIKKEEFKEFFRTTPFFYRLQTEIKCRGKEFEFDLEALAQHYEFKTNYLDITKDFTIAMFFAYTDYINGQYVPIDFQNKDKNYEPHIYIANLGILNVATNNEDLKVVGFQASPRPLAQKAMAINLSDGADVKNLFAKISLPKNEYFTVGIYNSFKKGYKLFKPDILSPFVAKIKESTKISPVLLERYCEEFNVESAEIKKELAENNYILENAIHKLSKEETKNMNKCIDNEILPYIRNYIGHRRVSKPL